ncbi:2-oxo-tetronate isomerase [Methylobacterium organophilum]|uniref:2-oxo-tetronate isomerase n=1 Tax=Methylobacterium organophilum TaxID=410 RepID=A0ABQ4T443_METOR|nr:2-oxo-tetronate isomerase [Methylobacterium organophilum]UMY18006.1 TIM barrel protein [Methylobacterium organophilum]GJE25730.1 2-oxo-tetronate isomerase [Methylobacterium organophilum]
MPRFAANLTLMFQEVPFLDRFAAAARAGFEAVEFLFPYAHPPEAIAARLAENSLTLALFNLPPGDWEAGERGLAALPGRRAAFRESLRTGLAYARATGARRLHLMAGLADPADPEALGAYRDALREAARFLAPEGLDLMIEPINRRSMPGYFLSDVDAAAALIEELALPNLRLQFDLFHCQILHGDVTERLRRYMPLIGHIQVASAPERHEPGSGELAEGFLFAEIDRLGYSGFIGCEYVPAGRTEEGLGWFAPYRRRTP